MKRARKREREVHASKCSRERSQKLCEI